METTWTIILTDDTQTADPNDGGGPIQFWWEDMRPREVRDLVIRVFERGRVAGLLEHSAGRE